MDDTYCYAPNYTVLKNRLHIQDEDDLQRAEALLTRQRMREPLDPPFEMTPQSYQAIHQHIFQDVYEWAGEYRSTQLFRGASAFEYPHVIDGRMEEIFSTHADLTAGANISVPVFARDAAQLMYELNDVHPFREGNGRAQRVFLKRLGAQAGFQIEQANIDAKLWMEGSVQSFMQGGKKGNLLMGECISSAIDQSRSIEMEIDDRHIQIDNDLRDFEQDGDDHGQGGGRGSR